MQWLGGMGVPRDVRFARTAGASRCDQVTAAGSAARAHGTSTASGFGAACAPVAAWLRHSSLQGEDMPSLPIQAASRNWPSAAVYLPKPMKRISCANQMHRAHPGDYQSWWNPARQRSLLIRGPVVPAVRLGTEASARGRPRRAESGPARLSCAC